MTASAVRGSATSSRQSEKTCAAGNRLVKRSTALGFGSATATISTPGIALAAVAYACPRIPAPATARRMPRLGLSAPLSLGCTTEQSLDEVLLQEDEKDDDRNRCKHHV